MKHKFLRIFLLSILAMMGGNVFADEVTLAYSGGTTTNMTGENDAALVGLDASAWSVVGDKGANSNLPGLNKAGDIRLYWSADGGNTITVKSLTGANINSIAMTFTGDTYSNVSVTVDGNAVTGADGVFTINSSSFVLGNANTSNVQVRISQVVITYGASTDTRVATDINFGTLAASGVIGQELPLPEAIVKAGGNAVDGATVTWESSDEKVAAINGDKVKLVAAGQARITASYAGSSSYLPSTQSYTVTVYEPYSSISDMLDDISSTRINVQYSFENLLVVYVIGSYTYVTDGTTPFLFYGSQLGLKAGDKVSGKISGQLYTYNGLPELSTNAKDLSFTVVSSGNEVTPKTITPAELAKTLNQYVAIKNAEFVSSNGKNYYFKVGDAEFLAYNQLNISEEVTSILEAGKTYDLTGFEGCFKETKQLFPVTIVPVAESQGFRDFAVVLTDANIFATDINKFGVKVAADSTYTATSFDDATANFTVNSARFNDADHGWVNCEFTVPVEGAVKVGLGNCQYGSQDGTITDAAGNVTALTVGNANCWHNDKQNNISYTIYKGTEPTTLTIKYNGYCPFISVEAVDPSQLKDDATVTFAAGEAEGAIYVPEAVKQEVGKTITLPRNFTMYVEGKTLTAWSDGTTEYAPGTEFTVPASDITLTAVFTPNEVSLADRTEPVTVKWNFRRDAGAPSVQWQNKDGLVWVTQAQVNGKSIDVALPFSTTSGKFNNTAWNDWAQLNQGTTFHVPSCKGAVVSMEAFSNITTTTIDGQSDYTPAQTISYEVANSSSTIDVVIGDGSYYRYLQVELPVAQQGGQSYVNEAASIEWPFNDPATITTSSAIPVAAFTTLAVNTGDLTITGAATRTADNLAEGITFIKLKPAGTTQAVEWVVKPAAGLTFTPTKVSMWIQRFGTDAENGVTISAKAGEAEAITLGNFTAPRANHGVDKDKFAGNSNWTNHVVIELTADQQAALASGEGLTLTATVGVGSSKEGGFSDVIIEGLVNGTKADVAMFTLTTVAAPEEGGTINVYPNADQYEEGSEVTLTANENFGYDFQSWTNAAGEVISNEAKFKYTINADETLTANFKKVDTYELALTVDGTNHYMVAINPEPTVIDGKWMYEAGQTVILTANQYEGLVTFNNWSDGETNSEKTITINENTQLTAIYSQADIIAGWDFYTAGSNGRTADFAAQDNDGDALNLVNTETGETSGWLDKSWLGAGGYESFKGAAVNWRTGASNGDVGYWHWQTKLNAEAFTDINVQFQMLYNYNAYQTYDAEYSLDGENWTKFGSITMTGAKAPAALSEQLPAAANNQKDLYLRMKADRTSAVDGSASANDGNTLAMFFITGTPKLVNDGKAPVIVSTVPADGATNVSANGKIVLTFDERVKMADNAKGMMSVKNGMSGAWLVEPTVAGKTISFEYNGLQYDTPFTFSLAAGTVADLTDNYISEPITINFTTMNRPTVQKGQFDVIVENVDQLLEGLKKAESRADKNQRFRIFVKNGTYSIPLKQTMKTVNGYEVPECITFLNASNVSFIGESRDGVVITNAIPADATFAGQYGTTSKYDGIGNSDVFQIGGSVQGLYWQDLTVSSGIEDARGRNIAIQDKGTKNVYKNVYLHGYQDTWNSNNDKGLYYFEDGVIRGRTDYMCGKGDIFWNRVELRQLAGGYAAVPSKPAKVGWVFKDCTINGDGNDVDGNYTLGRPWGSGTPVAVFIDTKMNVVPSAIGWNEMSDGWPARFAEWNSMTKTGTQIDLSGRKRTFGDGHANNPVLTAEEAQAYSDMTKMYGDWDPRLLTEQAPVPANAHFSGNQLTWDDSQYVLCWAIVKNGNVIAFTTEPTYTIDDPNAKWAVRAANEMGGLSEAAAANYFVGIEETATEPAQTDDTIYNMQGVRVEKAVRGLYIVNGRKVLVK